MPALAPAASTDNEIDLRARRQHPSGRQRVLSALLIGGHCDATLRQMKRRLVSVLAACALSALALAGQAHAAPPILLSVNHVDRHPEANWSLPAGVKSKVAEVAISPATSTDGYFFSENVKAFDVLEDSQTRWVYNFQLDPGTYYVHIAGIDEPCFFAGLCPVREFSQIMTLVIEARPPPPPPPPPVPPPGKPEPFARYQATVRTIHPGAIRDRSPNWTYLGDTVRVAFRNTNALARATRGYTVCYTRNRSLACRRRALRGRSWDAWTLRIMPPWAGYVRGRYRRYVEFTWRASGRIVARKRVWIYE
jgi:hypothetical protein